MGRGRWLGLGSAVLPRSRHGSYILVNDGTGRLYAAMDAEFATLGQQVADFVNGQAGLGPVDNRVQADFYPYRRADGKINFLAMVLTHRTGVIAPGSQQFAFVNVPLGIDITTGIKPTIRVAPENGGNTDTLTRVQRARFDDQTVDLSAL